MGLDLLQTPVQVQLLPWANQASPEVPGEHQLNDHRDEADPVLRGEADLSSKAVTRGQITLLEQSAQKMQQVSAKGTGFTISSQDVAGLDDYGLLLQDVQTLANDLAQTRLVVNILIKQLKG